MPRPLDGYPATVGYQMQSIFPHSGPASYTQMTVVPGTVPPVGGDIVQAIEAGLKYFDVLDGGGTDDGCFFVEAVPVSLSTTQQNAPSTTFRLRWFARKTATMGGQAQTLGNEAVAGTNLSTFTVRLTALGPKS